MVVDSQNPFTVAMFRPDDEQLEGIVTHSFFGDDANAFEQFVVDMSRLRAKCLAFLNAEAIGEAITQKVFLMFAEALLAALRERSACSLRVEAVNRLELTATLAMRDEPNGPVHEPREQRGYADVAFLSSVDGARLANDIRVIGELKADLRNATAYAEKDQLLIEMEALYQLHVAGLSRGQPRPFVKGYVTDLFCLNMAVVQPAARGRSRTFYMAPRVWEHRAFLVRLLFLLCEPLSREVWTAVLQRSDATVIASRRDLQTADGKDAAVAVHQPQKAAKAQPKKGKKADSVKPIK
eukprot:gene14260-biopygen6475